MQTSFPYLIVDNQSQTIVAGFVSRGDALQFKQNSLPGQYSIRHQSIVKAA